MKPVVAALLFHAPGLWLLAKQRLSPLAARLNVAALALTLVAMVVGGLQQGVLGVVVCWAVGHILWSLTLAALVHRGLGTRHDGGA